MRKPSTSEKNVRNTSAEKTVAKKPATKKAVSKKSVSKKTPAKKVAAKKVPAKKPAAVRTSKVDPIAEIRQALETLRAVSPEKPELYEVGPVWTEAVLAAFEAEHRVALPPDYRRYLLEVGDGGAGFLYHGPCCGGMKALTDLSSEAKAKLGKPFLLTASRKKLPPPDKGLFELGATSDHCICFLVVTGKAAGQVWVDGTGYDGGAMAPEKAGFLKQQRDYLVKTAAEEVDLQRPPDAERFLKMSLLEQADYLTTSKNTPLLLQGDLKPVIDTVLGKKGCAAWVRKHGGTEFALLEKAVSASFHFAKSTQEPNRPLLFACADLCDRLSSLYAEKPNNNDWHWSEDWQLKRAVVYAHAGEWEKCLALIEQYQMETMGNIYRLCGRIAAWCLGREPSISFEKTNDLESRLYMQRSVRELFSRAPEAVQTHIIEETPPFLLMRLFLYGFMHGKEEIELRLESIAVTRANAGEEGPLGLLRRLAERGVEGIRQGGDDLAFLHDDILDSLERFFTHPAGWDGLLPEEKNPEVARALLAAASLAGAAGIASYAASDYVVQSLLQQYEKFGGEVAQIKRDPLFP